MERGVVKLSSLPYQQLLLYIMGEKNNPRYKNIINYILIRAPELNLLKYLVCPICKREFNNKIRFITHLTLPTSKCKQSLYQTLTQILIEYKKSSYLIRTVRKRKSKGEYKCIKCGFKSKDKIQVILHIVNEHLRKNKKG